MGSFGPENKTNVANLTPCLLELGGRCIKHMGMREFKSQQVKSVFVFQMLFLGIIMQSNT